jgi:hypothetical protein
MRPSTPAVSAVIAMPGIPASHRHRHRQGPAAILAHEAQTMDRRLKERMAGPPRQWVFALVFAVVVAAIAAAGLWHLRNTVMEGQARELGLLSLALADEVDRGLQGMKEGLQAVQDELQEGRLPLGRADTARALRTRADLMPLVRTLWLADAAGHILSASDAAPPPAMALFRPGLDRLPDKAMAKTARRWQSGLRAAPDRRRDCSRPSPCPAGDRGPAGTRPWP